MINGVSGCIFVGSVIDGVVNSSEADHIIADIIPQDSRP